MQRVVQIERPFQHGVERFAVAAPSVVHADEGDGQYHRHLHKTVKYVQGEEIDGGINGNIEDHPKHLGFKLAAVGAEGQNAQTGNAAPIAGEGDQANEDDQHGLQRLAQPAAVRHTEHDQTPGKGPHDTGLVQQAAVVKGDEGAPVHKVPGCENIRKMGKQGKKEQLPGIFAQILCVMIALGNEVAHDRAGDAADQMQKDG